MKKLFVSITGTHDWQCKHMSFDTLGDFEDYCVKVSPVEGNCRLYKRTRFV